MLLSVSELLWSFSSADWLLYSVEDRPTVGLFAGFGSAAGVSSRSITP
jgi:hypothetical protein